jgi:hypothetical protein
VARSNKIESQSTNASLPYLMQVKSSRINRLSKRRVDRIFLQSIEPLIWTVDYLTKKMIFTRGTLALLIGLDSHIMEPCTETLIFALLTSFFVRLRPITFENLILPIFLINCTKICILVAWFIGLQHNLFLGILKALLIMAYSI